MGVNNFLASLPALLSILGFVIYYLLNNYQKGDPVTIRLLEKLRQDAPEKFKEHEKLGSKQLFELLSKDTSLRGKISTQDFKLLQQILKHRFVISLVVYLVCAVLFLTGIGLFVYQNNKPIALSVENIQLTSTNPEAKGLPVDLDTLKIQWNTTGVREDVSVYLENLDTKRRSKEISVCSSDGFVEVIPSEYHSILSDRQFDAWNRVRVVIQAKENKFVSSSFKLHVGLTILGIVFEEKVTIAAMIDNGLAQYYNFEALLVAWKKDDVDTLSLGNGLINGKRDYPVNNLGEYDWQSAKLTYLGPDDPRLVACNINY